MTIVLTLLGLIVFEVVNSVDNAVINAEVLATMQPKGRRFFLGWGLLIAVVLVRGVLPWLIVYFASPSLGLGGALVASFSSNTTAHDAITSAAPLLLTMGGVFLLFLFLYWVFLEDKNFSHSGERFLRSQGLWFYAVASLALVIVVRAALSSEPLLAFGAVIGSTIFFVLHGVKQNAEAAEASLKENRSSDASKILYLEVIDAVFSVDGVLGAFAFTLSVPLILIGNGIGALVVRQLTIQNVAVIRRYLYLKNGAMYSILLLSLVMLGDSFGFGIPEWVSPLATFVVVGFFFLKSHFAHRNGVQPDLPTD